jgi:hypothetical protein
MVARAGLPLQDLEFVQFHPTGGFEWISHVSSTCTCMSLWGWVHMHACCCMTCFVVQLGPTGAG